MPPPVTADTNIYVSALQFSGLPLAFLEQARAGAFRLAASPPILVEVRRVLMQKFAWPELDVTTALAGLERCTTLVHPTQKLTVVAEDPDDDRIIECALEVGSTYIVTGDQHLLRLQAYSTIKIVRVAEFLRLIPHW